jgi:hypothetical protein
MLFKVHKAALMKTEWFSERQTTQNSDNLYFGALFVFLLRIADGHNVYIVWELNNHMD